MRPLTAVWPAGAGSGEADMPTVTVSVLQFGSGHTRRELAHIQRRGIDKRHSFTLDVRLVTNLSASRLAVSSTSVDGAGHQSN
jgi:NitT/TauT family transport system substrate-binding protein